MKQKNRLMQPAAKPLFLSFFPVVVVVGNCLLEQYWSILLHTHTYLKAAENRSEWGERVELYSPWTSTLTWQSFSDHCWRGVAAEGLPWGGICLCWIPYRQPSNNVATGGGGGPYCRCHHMLTKQPFPLPTAPSSDDNAQASPGCFHCSDGEREGPLDWSLVTLAMLPTQPHCSYATATHSGNLPQIFCQGVKLKLAKHAIPEEMNTFCRILLWVDLYPQVTPKGYKPGKKECFHKAWGLRRTFSTTFPEHPSAFQVMSAEVHVSVTLFVWCLYG